MATKLRVAQRWNPSRYLRFENARLRPALDLVSKIEHADPKHIVDLGCGTGNMASVLRECWPNAEIICVDSSKDMLKKAQEDHEAHNITNISYLQADFESFTPSKPVDIIYSNAALHWVSYEIHQTLFPRLLSCLNPGGVFALQMPDSRIQPSHVLMQQAALELGFSTETIRWVTTEVDPEAYYELLSAQTDTLNMWSSTFTHTLSGDNPVADFTASTGLGPYVDAFGGIESENGQAFIAKYRELIEKKYPKQIDGMTLFHMKRFFLVATKGGSFT